MAAACPVVSCDTALRVLRRVNLVDEWDALALDVGGTLAKLVYLQPYGARHRAPRLEIERVAGESRLPRARALSVHRPDLRGTLHFFVFETRNIDECVRFLAHHWGRSHANPEKRIIRATGGGAYKYAALFEEVIGVRLQHVDEMSSVVAGLNYFLINSEKEVYRFDPPNGTGPWRKRTGREVEVHELEEYRGWIAPTPNPFPYLLVNIGSGVSILKVTGHDQFERVSGSTMGGGTFWGLSRLLLNCKTFDEVIGLTKDADNSKVDMMVRDIYGGSYRNVGLDGDVIAASFGKITMKKDHSTTPSISAAWRSFIRFLKGTWHLWLNFLFAVPIVGHILSWLGVERKSHWSLANLALNAHFNAHDVALSLLRMLSYNIGQIAYLNARRYDLPRIYFGGNFIRDHPYTLAAISFAVDFWSNGETQALFLRHDGFLGAVGAYLDGSTSKARKLPQRPIMANGATKPVSENTKTPKKKKKKKSLDQNPDSKSASERGQSANEGQTTSFTPNGSSTNVHVKNPDPVSDGPRDLIRGEWTEEELLNCPDNPHPQDPPSPPWVQVTRARKRKSH